MPVVSVTRLRVRSWRYLAGFAWYTLQSKRQLRRSPGFLNGALANAPGFAFWTTTAWVDANAMARFRDTDWHKRAMPKLLEWCDEASVARWTQDTAELPDAAAMLERLQTAGRISKVRHPSPEHAAGRTVPDHRAPRRGLPMNP